MKTLLKIIKFFAILYIGFMLLMLGMVLMTNMMLAGLS